MWKKLGIINCDIIKTFSHPIHSVCILLIPKCTYKALLAVASFDLRARASI